jgi:iron(II)-dependent oxidoreductase
MSAIQTEISAYQLVLALEEASDRTIELVADLSPAQLMGPRLSTTNPLLWDIGHSAWFLEFWVLRHFHQQAPMLTAADALYNSAEVAHDTRWDLPLPSKAGTINYKRSVSARVIELCGQARGGARDSAERYDETYFLKLALFHEYMHAEAITYTRQTLGYCAPQLSVAGDPPRAPEPTGIPASKPSGSLSAPLAERDEKLGDVEILGGTFSLGSSLDSSFAFDNEQWAHPVTLKPFSMARAAVSNREFVAFVDDGGYRRPELWTEQGWHWREQSAAEHPVYWRRDSNGQWSRRNFDRWLPLKDDLPVLHVNWYEADAHSRWARRRLPSEAEWEMAASSEPSPNGGGIGPRKRRFAWGDTEPTPDRANLDWRAMGCVSVNAHSPGDCAFGCRQMIGNVWEWTATDFGPYPGFAPGPYKEYSAPWFGEHKVLRGGCWVTRSGLISNVYRNFYKPDRRDVWAGFRTCGLE